MNTLPAASDPSSRPDTHVLNEEDRLIDLAIRILNERLFERGPLLANPTDVQRFLQLRLMPENRELFAVLLLDAGHRVLAFEVLSHGSLTRATVYPREIIQRAFAYNAAALIIAHNNPSGRTEPSPADRALTRSLSDLLGQLDLRLLDHFVIGQGEAFSFAEAGLI